MSEHIRAPWLPAELPALPKFPKINRRVPRSSAGQSNGRRERPGGDACDMGRCGATRRCVGLLDLSRRECPLCSYTTRSNDTGYSPRLGI